MIALMFFLLDTVAAFWSKNAATNAVFWTMGKKAFLPWLPELAVAVSCLLLAAKVVAPPHPVVIDSLQLRSAAIPLLGSLSSCLSDCQDLIVLSVSDTLCLLLIRMIDQPLLSWKSSLRRGFRLRVFPLRLPAQNTAPLRARFGCYQPMFILQVILYIQNRNR